MKTKILCPVCNQPWNTNKLQAYNCNCGEECDCECYRVSIECGHCGVVFAVKSDFGNILETNQNWKKEVTEDDLNDAAERNLGMII